MEREAEILAFLSKLLEGADLASLSIKYIRAKLEEDIDAKAGRDYERAWLRSTVDELLARIAPAPDSTHADAPAASLQLERAPKEDKPLEAVDTEETPTAVPAEEAKPNHGEVARPAESEAAGEEGGGRVVKKAPSLKQKYPDGTVIWAKMPSYPYWPSMVWRPEKKNKEAIQCIANGEVFVRFFGSNDYSFCRLTEDWLVGLSRDFAKRRQKNKKLEKQFREAMAAAQKELDEPSTWKWETEVSEAEDESEEEEEEVEGEEEQDAESDAAEQKPAYVDSSDEEAATSAERNVVKPAPQKPKAKPKAADATTPRKPKVAVVARSDEDEDEDEDEEAAAELEPDDKAKDADFAEREQEEGSDDEEKAGLPIAGGSKRRKRGGKAGGEAGEKKKTGKAALKAERVAAGEPKKNMNAYMFFSNEFRTSSGSGNAAESSKLASQKWKELTDEEREPYLAKAAADKERYQAELKAFRESHGETQAERMRKEAGKKPSKPKKPRAEGGGGGGGGGESMKQVLDKLAAAREQRLEVQVLISKCKKKLEKVEGWRVKMKEEGEPEEKLQQLDALENKVTEEHEAQLAKLAEIKGEMKKLVARVDELEAQQKERKRKKNEERLQEPVDVTREEDVKKAKRERHAESKPSHHEERKSERQREQREEEEEIRQQTRQVGRGAEDRRGDAPARPSRPRSEPTQEESAEGEKAGRAEGEKKKKRKLAVESDDEAPETDKPNGPTSEQREGSEHAKVDDIAARLAELLEWKRVLEGALATEGSVDDEAAAKALVGLERIEMTLALLEQSGIGKLITKLRKSSSHLAGRAKRLYEQWKALVSSSA
ncbi:hypothetical protein AB1Y20_020082 [Prymnesium parvum]|uniref:PWWP domain-containing protein n=1 Tax=Prymnesium parvum TaxID=97485 RepID=A0AB34JU57_PRYPA